MKFKERFNLDKNFELKYDELHNQDDFRSIINWIETNPSWLINNAKRNHLFKPIFTSLQFNINITYLTLSYSTRVSNSHSCPRNGVPNWGRHNNNIPNGYPGWEGLIEFQTSNYITTFGGDIFKNTGIHIGTGGARRNGGFGFSVRLFEDDWPGLNRYRVTGILSESNWDTVHYGFADYFDF